MTIHVGAAELNAKVAEIDQLVVKDAALRLEKGEGKQGPPMPPISSYFVKEFSPLVRRPRRFSTDRALSLPPAPSIYFYGTYKTESARLNKALREVGSLRIEDTHDEPEALGVGVIVHKMSIKDAVSSLLSQSIIQKILLVKAPAVNFLHSSVMRPLACITCDPGLRTDRHVYTLSISAEGRLPPNSMYFFSVEEVYIGPSRRVTQDGYTYGSTERVLVSKRWDTPQDLFALLNRLGEVGSGEAEGSEEDEAYYYSKVFLSSLPAYWKVVLANISSDKEGSLTDKMRAEPLRVEYLRRVIEFSRMLFTDMEYNPFSVERYGRL